MTTFTRDVRTAWRLHCLGLTIPEIAVITEESDKVVHDMIMRVLSEEHGPIKNLNSGGVKVSVVHKVNRRKRRRRA